MDAVIIAPASINYDNVKVALDTAVARKEASTTKAIADAQKTMETSISNAQKSIKANEAKMELHKKYVEARKEKVAAVTHLYNEIGIDKLAKQKIASYFDSARKYLDAVNIAEERESELRMYADKMLHRNK